MTERGQPPNSSNRKNNEIRSKKTFRKQSINYYFNQKVKKLMRYHSIIGMKDANALYDW